MGEVYRAHDPRLNREVALKILRPEFADDADRLQRFVREAQALASLNHPHIAQIHGVEDAPASAPGHVVRALVMEFVDGEDLSARLLRAPLLIDEALEIARQIAEALEAAHEQGIIHRDLKPANVKIRHDGAVKVLDFGLAKALAAGMSSSSAASPANSPTFTIAPMTAANVILGTAAYMSPEQARGKPVDKRSDIWSFGVVLYEMLARRPAYTGETITDLMAAVVTRDPDWRALPDAVPSSVRGLLRRCLEKDPRVRLRDIGEARVVLAKPADADGAAAKRDDRTRGRERILPWAVAAVALMVAAAALILRPAPEAPTRKLEIAMPGDVVASTVMLSPDGTRVAYRAGDRVVVTDLEKLLSNDVAVSKPSQRNALFWSHDSSFVGYNDVDGKLWVVPAAGGSPRLVCAIPETGQLMGAAWASSNTITLAVWRGSLYQVPAAGGEPTLLAAIDPNKDVDFHTPVVLADGRIMVAAHLMGQASNGEPFRVDVIGKQGRETALGSGFVPVGYTASGHLLAHRRDANVGLWAFPYSGRLPLRVEDGFLVAPGAEFPTFADDGSILYSLPSTVPESSELAWIDRTGELIGPIGPEQSEIATPSLSPDGGRLAFAARSGSNVNVWVRDLLGNTQTQVTFNAAEQTWPTWFPSGKRLAYWEVGGIGLNRVAAANSDGSGGRQELTTGQAPQVSPDGRFITYGVDERGDTQLRYSALSPEGEAGPATPVFRRNPEPSVHGVRFSPDGRYLVYGERQPGGAIELFMTTFPTGEGRWQISRGGGRSPAWAATGELFFAEGSTDGPKSMMSVSIKTGAPPTVGTPSKLFNIRADIMIFPRGLSFDASRDGKRFVMIRSRRPSSSPSAMRWVLVQNWLREFK